MPAHAAASPVHSPAQTVVSSRWWALRSWAVQTVADWQRVFLFGAMSIVLLLSPSTYDRANLRSMAQHIHATSWRVLPLFGLLSGLVSLALIRVVLVTALHYGLQKFALDLVVRVLVLEVIPLFAALYVALRNAVSPRTATAGIFLPEDLDRLDALQTDRIRDELVPRVVAYMVSVLTMVVASGLVTLLMAYWSVYGFSRWGLDEFARAVGQGFDGVGSLIFVAKVLTMGLAVAVIPIAAGLDGRQAEAATRLAPGAMRLFVVLFVLEGLALMLRYL
jgi:phospholipid/cholesterol/gamma-HCH transport system permease protein